MLHSNAWLIIGRRSESVLHDKLEAHMSCIQICGGYVDAMTRCAQLLEEQIEVDFVDANCGCPIDLVCNKCAPAGV